VRINLKKQCLQEELERLKVQLNNLVNEGKSLVDPDVVALSQRIDGVILRFYR
jgi:hypothetical protein